MSTPSTSTFIGSLHHIYGMIVLMERGPGVADAYILCLEEFTSVGMLPPSGSSMFRILLLAK
jgi:hypothetical protein